MFKKIIAGVLALLVLTVVGVMLLGSNLDSIVKVAIEKYGTEATKVETTLADVKISLQEGKVSLLGFTLANPKGFSDEKAMNFSEITVEVRPESIVEDGPIKIRRILIDSPTIAYEVNKDGSSNLQTFQSNIAEFSREVNQKIAKAASDKKAAAEEKAERKLIIDEIVLKNGKLKLKHTLLTDGDMADISLPPIHMFNIGNGNEGVSPAIVAQRVLGQIVSEAVMTGQATVMREIRQRALNAVQQTSGIAKDTMEGTANDTMGNAAEEATKALGNLLGQ